MRQSCSTGTSLFTNRSTLSMRRPLFRCPIYDGPTDPTLEWNTGGRNGGCSTQRRANVPNLQEGGLCIWQ